MGRKRKKLTLFEIKALPYNERVKALAKHREELEQRKIDNRRVMHIAAVQVSKAKRDMYQAIRNEESGDDE